MKNLINKKLLILVLLILIFNLNSVFSLASAAVWRYGALHTHTGYSTAVGYDNNGLNTGDNCYEEATTWFPPWDIDRGYSVAELKEQALDTHIRWLGFSDHSYCLDSSEFNTVKTDCENAQDSGFTCLAGEELSVDDNYAGWWDELLCGGGGQTAHLGGYGMTSYLSGGVCFGQPYDQQTGIDTINNQNAVSIINHPADIYWDFESIDYVSGETGIEIWNEGWSNDDQETRNLWVWDKLQENEKIYAYGGTDSHSEISIINYNLVKMDSLTHSGLKAGLKSGTSIVSNNGYVVIWAKTNTQASWTDMGGSLDAYTGEVLTIYIEHYVMYDCTLTVRRSEIGSGLESLYTYSISGFDEFGIPYSLTDTGNYYFRAECISSDGNYRIYTNPIWVDVHYAPPEEVCYDGIDNDADGYADCADGDCLQGTKSQSGFCCGSGCSSNGGSCSDASTSGFTCKDGNCNSYSEACQNGELESSLVCSGTSLSCSDGSCEAQFGAPSYCDEITPGDTACENSLGSYDELACELSGTNCYYEAEYSCGAPSGCDEKDQNDCSDNSGLQCEWQNAYSDNVVEECESGCGASSQCDEKSPLTDLNACNLAGQTYYEDECSSSCSYQDITSVFECTETGCSCSESLCDGLSTGSNILTCSSGQTYFADKCTSTAGGEDRGDNICRSSAFASGCTADSECNGIEAGTGDCSATCSDTTHKFYIKDSSNNNVAWFGNFGNIVLKGTCTSGGTCTAPADNAFTLKNATDDTVAYVNSTGDLCIETGDCSDNSPSCNNSIDNAFVVRNESDDNVIYIDSQGDLCLIGSLIENGNP